MNFSFVRVVYKILVNAQQICFSSDCTRGRKQLGHVASLSQGNTRQTTMHAHTHTYWEIRETN